MSGTRAQLMTFLKHTKPYHGVKNLSVLDKGGLIRLRDSLLNHPTGGNFFTSFWNGIKKGADIAKNFILPVAKIIPPFAAVANAVEKPIDIIRGLGSSGGGPVRIKIKQKGVLKPFGYTNIKSLSPQQRHSALQSAIDSGTMTPLQLWHRLNALMVFQKANPASYDRFRADRDWVKKMYLISGGYAGGAYLDSQGLVVTKGMLPQDNVYGTYEDDRGRDIWVGGPHPGGGGIYTGITPHGRGRSGGNLVQGVSPIRPLRVSWSQQASVGPRPPPIGSVSGFADPPYGPLVGSGRKSRGGNKRLAGGFGVLDVLGLLAAPKIFGKGGYQNCLRAGCLSCGKGGCIHE